MDLWLSSMHPAFLSDTLLEGRDVSANAFVLASRLRFSLPSLILKYLFETAVAESILLPVTSILVFALRGHGFHAFKSVLSTGNETQIKFVVEPTCFTFGSPCY